jgi:hypothetical protein
VLTSRQLERTLTLLANGEIDIRLVVEDKETTGTKRKRKTTKSAAWKVEQLNGPPQPFSDTPWGDVTREYMSALQRVPRDAMATIIYEARLAAAMNHKARASSKGTVSEHGQRATLAFR